MALSPGTRTIFLMVISSAFLFHDGVFYKFVATLLFFSLISPIIDYLLRKCGIHIILLRFIFELLLAVLIPLGASA